MIGSYYNDIYVKKKNKKNRIMYSLHFDKTNSTNGYKKYYTYANV